MVGAVMQDVQLFNATILENICLEENPNAEHVVSFCREVGFHGFIMEFQQGYSSIVSENSVNLSGGQRQLVALARALYHQSGCCCWMKQPQPWTGVPKNL